MPVLTKDFLTAENTASTSQPSCSAETSALVAEALRRGAHSPQDTGPGQGPGQRLRLRVYGESMLPALWPGEVVEIASCSMPDLRPGDIVLAVRDGRLFLHRLIAPCTPEGFRLRGDSMPACDPLYPPQALLGRLVRGTEEAQGFSSRTLSRTLGMVFCQSGMARRLAFKLHGWRMGSTSGLRRLESI